MLKFEKNQVWLDAKYGTAGVQFYPREILRLMLNVEYDHDIRAFIVRFTTLGLTLWLDIYLKPELFRDRPEVESI